MGNDIPFTKIPSSEYIDVATASKKQFLNLSTRHVTRLCAEGFFKTAFKPGTQGRTSKWLILRTEVITHRMNGHSQLC